MAVIIGDSGCGAVDCIQEVSFNENIPCVTLDTRKDTLVDSIATVLTSLGLSKSFWIRLANWNRKLLKKDLMVTEYVDSLSEERLVDQFHSLLSNIPSTEDSHSCSVIIRCSSLSKITEHDMSLLSHLHESFPSVFIFLTCFDGPLSPYEEIPQHTQSLFVLLR